MLLNKQGDDHRRRVLLNAASNGLASGWAMLVSLVGLPLLLAGMGAEAFGVWILIQTMSAITGWFSIADLGMGTATTRAVAERASLNDHAGLSRVVGTACVVYALLGMLFGSLLAVFGPPSLPSLFNAPAALVGDLRAGLVVYSLAIFLDLVTGGFLACMEGLQRLDLARAVDGGRRTILVAATVTTASLGGGLRGVAIAAVLASACGTLGGVWVLLRHLPSVPTRPDRQEGLRLLRYGSTVALLNATGVLHRTMDRLIVGAAFGPEAVVLVEIATQAQNGVAAVLSAGSYTAISSAAWLRARGATETLQQLCLRGTRYSSFAVLPVAAVVMVLSGPLVRVWVGERFTDAGGLIVVAVIAIAAAAPLQVGSNLLQGSGKAAKVLQPAAVAVVVNLVASLTLVQVMGTVGTFVGTLVGTVVLTPALLRAILDETKLPARRFIVEAFLPPLGPAAAAALVSGLVLALPLLDVYTVVMGAGLALGTALVITVRWQMSREERRQIRETIFPMKPPAPECPG